MVPCRPARAARGLARPSLGQVPSGKTLSTSPSPRKPGTANDAEFRFATSPQEAPILHFDGPRRFVLSDKFGPHRFRPGESCELAVELRTQGWDATVRTDFDEVPEDIHPVADIEFPPGRPGEDPIRVRVELKERC